MFPATMVLPMFTSRTPLSMPPPLTVAELPLTVQLVSVVMAYSCCKRPPPLTGRSCR